MPKYGWYAAVQVTNKDGQSYPRLYRTEAENVKEAIGLIYLEVITEYAPLEGWLAPLIDIEENPVIIDENYEYPVILENFDG